MLGRVRIIAGFAKGIRLKTPKGLKTRPTADRVKESVFAILGEKVLNARVLDLFSGTGNLGLEALSRGAREAVLVDHNSQSIKIIIENSILTDFTRATIICREDAFRALRRLEKEGNSFDLIFCDPPYNMGFSTSILDILGSGRLLNQGGLLVLEHSKHEKISESGKRIVAIRSESYGETVVSFFAKQEGTDCEESSVPREF